MNSKILFFIIFFSAVLSFHRAAAAAGFNITAILATRPSFSTFNDFLTRTGVADTINSRPPPVTVLAVANGNISAAAPPPEVLKKIVSVHVLLGYYDAETLRNMGNTSVTVTTLFQTSGQAENNQGSINITGLGSGSVGFRSVGGNSGGGAASGAAASLVAPVVAQPYNFSVLQISNFIVPPGIENNSTNTNSSSAPATSPITPPSSSPTIPPSANSTTPPSASPSTPPASSPTDPPTASPTKPPSPSPRKMISPSPGPSASPESAPTPTAPAADDESSSNSVGVGIVASTILSLNLFLVLFV